MFYYRHDNNFVEFLLFDDRHFVNGTIITIGSGLNAKIWFIEPNLLTLCPTEPADNIQQSFLIKFNFVSNQSTKKYFFETYDVFNFFYF